MGFICSLAAIALVTYWICNGILKVTGWKDDQERKAAMTYIVTKAINNGCKGPMGK